jgi:hypothetical protein
MLAQTSYSAPICSFVQALNGPKYRVTIQAGLIVTLIPRLYANLLNHTV